MGLLLVACQKPHLHILNNPDPLSNINLAFESDSERYDDRDIERIIALRLTQLGDLGQPYG